MKKLLSLILALAMVMSFATISYAADYEFEMYLVADDMETEITEVNVGDMFYLYLTCGTKTELFGVNLSMDTTAFTVSEADSDFGYHSGAPVVNPNGVANTINVGGMASKTRAIDSYVAMTANTAGTYTFTFNGAADGFLVGDAVSCDPATVTIKVIGEEEEEKAPTAADLGLFTDASQNFKVTTPVMTSNKYAIEKALGFVSGIYADAAVVKYGTEITCEGYEEKVLDIPAANTYDADANVKGFVAAVTSIRNENLNKTFTAKAYADVTVGEETIRIYADNAATAVYAN
jgi:hypothetical protein